MHLAALRADSFPYGTVVILEEAVKDAVDAGGRGSDIDKANQLSRFYSDVAGLLRYQDVRAEYGGVVNIVIVAFALELNIGGGKGFLTPEAVESRELGILEAGDIDTLLEFESCGNRLAHNDIAAAEAEFEEELIPGDFTRRKGAAGRGALRLGTAGRG